MSTMKRLVFCGLLLMLGSCDPKPKPKHKFDSSLMQQIKIDLGNAKAEGVQHKRDLEALLQRK